MHAWLKPPSRVDQCGDRSCCPRSFRQNGGDLYLDLNPIADTGVLTFKGVGTGYAFDSSDALTLIEHDVLICGGFGNGVGNLPMLDDLAVLHPEHIHHRGSSILRRGLYAAAQHDQFPLADNAPKRLR
jgi:hypothetical protein